MENTEDNSDIKNLVISNTVEAFVQDPKIKDKLTSIVETLAGPAFNMAIKHLGENDDYRYMIYYDKQYGLIIHKLKTSTTELSFDEPKEGDINIITKENISNISAMLQKFFSGVIK